MNGGVEEIKNGAHGEVARARAVWDECELEPCRPLSQCSVRSSEQGEQSRDAATNNKEERLQKQTSSAVVLSTGSMSHWSMYL